MILCQIEITIIITVFCYVLCQKSLVGQWFEMNVWMFPLFVSNVTDFMNDLKYFMMRIKFEN